MRCVRYWYYTLMRKLGLLRGWVKPPCRDCDTHLSWCVYCYMGNGWKNYHKREG